MSNDNLDDRTRLLLSARIVNGVKMVVDNELDQRVMQQMVAEGLFYYSDIMFHEGYWWTYAGMVAADKAWQQVPVQRVETRYRNHPQVHIGLNGRKEEVCYVTRPNYAGPSWSLGLGVRKVLDQWLVDHPNGLENVPFGSADEAIAWALEQLAEAQ